MTLTVKGKTYSSQSVKKHWLRGTKQYYDDPNGTYLTETEMAELASVAKAEKHGSDPAHQYPWPYGRDSNRNATIRHRTPLLSNVDSNT